MMIRKRLAIALVATTALAAASMLPTAASAQSVEQLQKQIDAMQAQINEMKEAQKKADKDGIKVKWEPAPKISSPDGRFEMNLRGRMYIDAAWISDDDDAIDVDATEFRTARLGIEGKAWNNVKYKFEADFAGNEVDLKDAYIGYKTGFAGINVGHFKTPNSLEEQTSSRHITFMERGSITDAFDLARQMGVGVGFGGDNWTATVGAFKGSSDGGSGEDQGETIAARVTFGGKLGNDNGAYHVGAHYRHRNLGDDESNFRYRQRPHQHLSSTRLVSTSSFADSDSLFGVELAGVFGPFSAQAEYMQLKADRATPVVGFDDPTFKGWYADVSWFVTGESRAYKADKGAFDRIKPINSVHDGGFGAWQLAFRYDVIDLTDEDIFGGEQKTWIAGVNWHLNNYSRIMFNYSHSKIDEAFDVSANGADGENSVDAFGMRFQVDW